LYFFKSIADYQEALTDNATSCLEMVNYYLTNIDTSSHLNAFVEVFKDESRERATFLDTKRKEGLPCGKLYGVVMTIKDVISYKDHKVTAGSKMLANYTSIYSSTAVEKLLSEDVIIIGNCNCDEFAMGNTNENSVYGRVKNALDPNKVSGGSSGGSAVSVQADMCMVALGSDTGGSVRQPADFCGVYGFKPSYGAISRHGLLAYASSFDQIGVIARNPEDAAKVFEVIHGRDEHDSTVSSREYFPMRAISEVQEKKPSYKIAVIRNLINHSSLDTEIKDAIYTLADDLKKEGHEVKEIDLDLVDYMVPAYYILTTAEASSNLSRYDGVRYGFRAENSPENISDFYKKNRSLGFNKEVKKRIMLGTFVLSEGFYDAYYTKAQQVRKLLAKQSKEIFKEFDIILLPTVPSTAFEAGSMVKDPIAMYLADIYTIFANLCGIPGASVPLFKHSNGMPFGAQILAARNNDVALLEFSNILFKRFKRN
jgi:aspartyl-tRNA(Asn)/glutamyl-tRNA(Gln) amidotransferase subunit A